MRVRLAALVLLAACHRSSSSPSPVPLEASTPDPCAAIASARAQIDAGAPTFGAKADPGASASCVADAKGAWSVLVESVSPMIGPAFPGTELRFVRAENGVIARGERESWAVVDALSVFDFDGDGEPELIVRGKRGCAIDQDLQCVTPLSEVEILTFAKGAVVPYRAPLATSTFAQEHVAVLPSEDGAPKLVRSAEPSIYRSADDVDGDGRPDLSTWLAYDLLTSDGDVTMYRLHGPAFVAHSLPSGDFSLDDDVARAALAKSCDATEPFETAKADGLVATAVCARLRGATVADVSKRYVARCRPLQAEVKRALADMIKGKGVDPNHVDWAAQGACRTEPEGGWSTTVGIPRSLVALLEDTKPVLAGKPPVAKP